MVARHVSDLTGPSLGAFYELYLQIWYMVICVLLDMSSRYDVTAGHFLYLVGLHIYNHIYVGGVGALCSVRN